MRSLRWPKRNWLACIPKNLGLKGPTRKFAEFFFWKNKGNYFKNRITLHFSFLCFENVLKIYYSMNTRKYLQVKTMNRGGKIDARTWLCSFRSLFYKLSRFIWAGWHSLRIWVKVASSRRPRKKHLNENYSVLCSSSYPAYCSILSLPDVPLPRLRQWWLTSGQVWPARRVTFFLVFFFCGLFSQISTKNEVALWTCNLHRKSWEDFQQKNHYFP